MEVSAILPIISIFFSVISGVVLLILQVRQKNDTISADTLKKYEDALEIRNTTIDDLKKKIESDAALAKETIAATAKVHAAQIESMQSQISGLQAQITALTTKNKVLEEAVTGKVYLEQILGMLTAFSPLIAKDGILEEYRADHKRFDTALEDIKQKLGIVNRHEDTNGTIAPGN